MGVVEAVLVVRETKDEGLGCLWPVMVAIVCWTAWKIALLIVTGKP